MPSSRSVGSFVSRHAGQCVLTTQRHVHNMNRRTLLETLAAGPAMAPLAARPAAAEPWVVPPAEISAEMALPGPSPRIRLNLNRNWRFVRHRRGPVCSAGRSRARIGWGSFRPVHWCPTRSGFGSGGVRFFTMLTAARSRGFSGETRPSTFLNPAEAFKRTSFTRMPRRGLTHS
jgi:hypothetical protein